MYKSEQEIDQIFSEHLDSLKISGLPFDEADVLHAWGEAKAEFLQQDS